MTSQNSKISDFWITGLLTATCTPFTENGDIDFNAIDLYVQHLVDFKVSNLFVNGTSGEGNSMTVDERKLVTEAWLAAGRGRFSAIVIHIGSGTLSDSQELARHAHHCGADAIACVGPTYLRPDSLDAYVQYMKLVAGEAPYLPFYLYDIDFVTGIQYTAVQFFDAALDVIPTLRGVKHSSMSLSNMLTLVSRYGRRVQVLGASDDIYLPLLAVGIQENFSQSFLCRVLIRIKEAFDRGDLVTARMEQVRAIKVCAIKGKYGFNFPTFAKVILAALGLKQLGQPRPPLSPYTDNMLESARKDLDEMGFFEWC